MEDESRRSQRLRIDLPIKVRTDTGELLDMELADISDTGMRLLGDSLGILKHNSDQHSQHVEFEVRIVARLAWIEPKPDKTFAIGLEFDRGSDGEELIG